MPGGIKASTYAKRQRIDEVIEMMGRGMLRYQILGDLTVKYNVGVAGVQRYIDEANKILSAAFTDSDIIAAYQSIFAKTYDKLPALALKAMDSIAKFKKGGYDNTVTIFNVTLDEDAD